MKIFNYFIILAFCFSLFGKVNAQIPYSKGRIAISSDGNANDPDDYGATAASLMMLAKAKLQDKLVLYTYSDHIWLSHGANRLEEMRESVNGAKSRWNYNKTTFIEAVSKPEEAYNAMRDAINASTADNPLTIIVAGPTHVIGVGLKRAKSENRHFVTLISHSSWNENHAENSCAAPCKDNHDGITWAEMKRDFKEPNYIDIVDQNKSSYANKGFSTRTINTDKWAPWTWMKNHSDASVKWVYSRMQASGHPDISDAGMVWHLLNNDENGNPIKLKNFIGSSVLGGGVVNPPTGSGVFFIINRQTGKKIRPISDADGAVLVQTPASWTGDYVQWEKVSTAGSNFYLKNKKTGMYFRPETNDDGSILIQRPTSWNGTWTQWSQVNTTGDYFHLKNMGTSKYIRPASSDDMDASTETNYNLQLKPTNNTDNWTQWKFVNVSTGNTVKSAVSGIQLSSNDVMVYPNPSNGKINVLLDVNVEKANISLIDIKGRIVYQEEYIESTDMHIDTYDFAKGMYLLKVKTNIGTQVKEVVSQ